MAMRVLSFDCIGDAVLRGNRRFTFRDGDSCCPYGSWLIRDIGIAAHARKPRLAAGLHSHTRITWRNGLGIRPAAATAAALASTTPSTATLAAP